MERPLHPLLICPSQRLIVASGDFSLECLGISSPPLYRTVQPRGGALGYGCPGLQKDTSLPWTSVPL